MKTGNAFWICTKDPTVQAFTDLLNRAIDKPTEHIQVAGADGGPLVIRWQTDEEPSGSDDGLLNEAARPGATNTEPSLTTTTYRGGRYG